MGLKDPGNRVWISDSGNPKRKLRHTLELVEADGTLVGINTNHPNRLAQEALETGRIPSLNFDRLRREVKYGENSRIDLLLEKDNQPDTLVEVKNVHLVRNQGIHEFPDSVTTRGTKHLNELAREVAAGRRAVMLYIIQREDGDRLRFAADIDPKYAAAFNLAHMAGVEAFALRCRISLKRIDAVDIVPVEAN